MEASHQGSSLTCLLQRFFFAFLFEEKEERDLILGSSPYFMGLRDVYLNIWTPDFNLENDIPSTIHV
jgi:hypothetical protein